MAYNNIERDMKFDDRAEPEHLEELRLVSPQDTCVRQNPRIQPGRPHDPHMHHVRESDGFLLVRRVIE